MVRCPQCGIRLRAANPVCSAHGAAPAPPPAPNAASGPPGPREEEFSHPGFRVERTLGVGGFGTVYSGIRIADSTVVAIKVAHREQLAGADRLAAEAEAMALVGSPVVPAILERGTHLGRYYVVMEHVNAPTLAELLADRAGPMPLAEFRRASLDMLHAVSRIHACRLVHRDLKPENIFVERQGVRIIDFGLAKRTGLLHPERPRSPSADGAATDDAMGTPEYMAPEQCDGKPADERADLYALGVMFYEMLSGAPPFFGNSSEVQESHRSRRPSRLSAKLVMESGLDDVIMRCLAKDPAKRWASAPELRDALDAALRTSGASALSTRELGATPSSSHPAPSPDREKRPLGLVFFESPAGLVAIQQALAMLGGQLAQANRTQYVAVFGHEVGDNPARAALRAAQGLVSRKLCERAVVDVAPVTIQLRPDGTRRFMSALFSRKDRFAPSGIPPHSTVLTQAAVNVVPDLPTAEVTGHTGLFKLDLRTGSKEVTTLWVGTGELVGREELIDSLTASAAVSLKQPSPTIITVIGEAGHGKSHVASTLVQHLEKLAFSKEVIAVAAYESVGGAVDQTLRRMLVRVLHLPEESPGGDHGRALIVQRLGEQVGSQVWAAVSLVLGWVLADHPDVRSLSAASGALRSAVSRALGEALRMRARARPVAIVFDDAHLADPAVLDAFEYATLGEAGSAIWICVFARPSFEHGRPAWGTRAGSAAKRAIEPLDAVSAAKLARRLLHPAENVSRRALARLYDRTRGVPRLLVELVRGLKREGIVRRAEHGTGYYLATDELDKLPDLPIVQWSASREVEALPVQLAAHARLASVLGAKFTTDEVDYVLDWLEREAGLRETNLDASVGIQRLIEAGLVVRHRTGQIDFRHPLLRETVYTGVPDAQKATIHRAAYEMYRARPSGDAQDRSGRLAFHAARCGLKSEAGELYVKLARAAEQTHAYIDAEMFYDAALSNLPESSEELVSEAIQGRGMMRFHVGRGHDALRDFETARTRARTRGAREAEIDILLDQAEVFDWMGDFARSETLAHEARDMATGVDADLLRMRLAVALGRVHYRLGRMEQCIETLKPSVGEARRTGDSAYEVLVIALLIGGPACARLGKLEEADEMLSFAVTTCEQHGDFHHLAAALNNRMFIALAREELDKALLDLERVVEISREVGFTHMEVLAQNNLGECKFFQGRFEEAIVHARRVIDLCERTGTSVGYLCSSLTLLARIELYRGNLAEAHAGAERVRECMRRSAVRGVHLEMTANEALLLEMVELGAIDVADTIWEDFYARAKAELQPHEIVELLELRANAAQRRGHRDLVRACIDEALKAAESSARILAARVRSNAARLAARVSAPRISVPPAAQVKSETPPP